MGLKCHLDTGKQTFLIYFDKNAQTPQNDTVNSWRVNNIINLVGLSELMYYFYFVQPLGASL